MHGVPVVWVTVSLEEHEPAEWSGVDLIRARVLILCGGAEIRCDQSNMNIVAVEFRASLRPSALDAQSCLLKVELVQQSGHQIDQVGRQIPGVDPQLA